MADRIAMDINSATNIVAMAGISRQNTKPSIKLVKSGNGIVGGGVTTTVASW